MLSNSWVATPGSQPDEKQTAKKKHIYIYIYISTLDNSSWILQTCFALISCESHWNLWEVYENVQSREDEKVREGREGEAEEELEEGKEAMLRGGGSWRRTGGRKYEENGEKEGRANVWNIMRELWEDHESIIRTSVGRGVGREGGDKALAGRNWRRVNGERRIIPRRGKQT